MIIFHDDLYHSSSPRLSNIDFYIPHTVYVNSRTFLAFLSKNSGLPRHPKGMPLEQPVRKSCTSTLFVRENGAATLQTNIKLSMESVRVIIRGGENGRANSFGQSYSNGVSPLSRRNARPPENECTCLPPPIQPLTDPKNFILEQLVACGGVWEPRKSNLAQ